MMHSEIKKKKKAYGETYKGLPLDVSFTQSWHRRYTQKYPYGLVLSGSYQAEEFSSETFDSYV